MKRPIESDYISLTAYTRALEEYCDTLAQPEQEPVCPDCKAKVLYECVACSSNNYPPKTKQEPVGYWMGEFNDGAATLYEVPQESVFGRTYRNMPVYTTPPQRKPLRDEIVNTLYQNLAADERTKQFTAQNWFQAGFSTGEAAHGIKEES